MPHHESIVQTHRNHTPVATIIPQEDIAHMGDIEDEHAEVEQARQQVQLNLLHKKTS